MLLLKTLTQWLLTCFELRCVSCLCSISQGAVCVLHLGQLPTLTCTRVGMGMKAGGWEGGVPGLLLPRAAAWEAAWEAACSCLGMLLMWVPGLWPCWGVWGTPAGMGAPGGSVGSRGGPWGCAWRLQGTLLWGGALHAGNAIQAVMLMSSTVELKSMF